VNLSKKKRKTVNIIKAVKENNQTQTDIDSDNSESEIVITKEQRCCHGQDIREQSCADHVRTEDSFTERNGPISRPNSYIVYLNSALLKLPSSVV